MEGLFFVCVDLATFFFVAKEMATHVWLKSYGSKAHKKTPKVCCKNSKS